MIPTPLVEQLSTALARWTVACRATTTRSKALADGHRGTS
jgi:hypothetical protein